jgi:hypothetical protein
MLIAIKPLLDKTTWLPVLLSLQYIPALGHRLEENLKILFVLGTKYILRKYMHC